MTDFYDSPHQFEPLMPSEMRQEPLLSLAHDLAVEATGLAGIPIAKELGGGLLRAMNSYYTNRIEGQHTRPTELDQALRHDFSKDEKLAARQRLAIAHIKAEEQLEDQFAGREGVAAHGVAIEPGAMRTLEVRVGRHVAPAVSSLDSFIARWAQFYGGVRRGESTIVALAASHQRIGWIHLFIDGNGRVMRLHTHLLLKALGYTAGVWLPLGSRTRAGSPTTP